MLMYILIKILDGLWFDKIFNEIKLLPIHCLKEFVISNIIITLISQKN